jgi:phosphoribosylformimino-5-aminoimidazole carboxamide ribotide isomerase
LIPAIDLQDGRCVRLFQGDFDAQTVYSTTPLEVLNHYANFGADRVHVVDLDGARDGAQANDRIITELVDSGRASLQVGGGLRTFERVKALLAKGVARAVIGSTAVTQPEEVRHWGANIGADKLVLAFDVRIDEANVPWLTTHGWQRQSTTSLWDALGPYVSAGFAHVLCTDIARDGALAGPNIALYKEAVRRFPQIQWQASGGVASARDLHALADCGVAAVISGKALLEKRIPIQELQPFLPNASSPA